MSCSALAKGAGGGARERPRHVLVDEVERVEKRGRSSTGLPMICIEKDSRDVTRNCMIVL